MRKFLTLITMLSTCLSMLAMGIGGKSVISSGTKTYTSSDGMGITRGSIIYDATNHTMTLDNVTMSTTENNCIYINKATTIILKGTNVLSAVDRVPLYLEANTTIKSSTSDGTDKLTVVEIAGASTNLYPAIMADSCSLRINPCVLDLTSAASNALSARKKGTSSLTMTGVDMTLKSKDNYYPIFAFKTSVMYGCGFTSHSDVTYNTDNYGYCSGSSYIKTSATIKSKTYPVKVAGTTVTGKNMSDVLGDGTVTFIDGEGWSYGNLVFDNATISTTNDCVSVTADWKKTLFISARGTNTLTSKSGKVFNINNNGSVVFDETGTLNCTANGNLACIDLGAYVKSVSVRGNEGIQITAQASNNHAIYISNPDATVSLKEAKITARTYSTYSQAFYSKAPVTFDNSFIEAPSWGKFNLDCDGIVDSENQKAKTVIINPGEDYNVAVCGIYLNSNNYSSLTSLLKEKGALVSGNVTYQHNGSFLIFSNANIVYDSYIVKGNKNIKITSIGTNTLKGTGIDIASIYNPDYEVSFRKSTSSSLATDGQLSITNTRSEGENIYAKGVEFYNTNVNLSATASAIKAETILFDGANVSIESGTEAIYPNCEAVTFNKSYITGGGGVCFDADKKGISNGSSTIYKKLNISRGYGIRIMGEDITPEKLTLTYGTGGKAVFDPSTNVLKMSGYAVNYPEVMPIFIARKDLTINVESSCVFNYSDQIGMECSAAGKVKVTGELLAIDCNKSTPLFTPNTDIEFDNARIDFHSTGNFGIFAIKQSVTFNHSIATIYSEAYVPIYSRSLILQDSEFLSENQFVRGGFVVDAEGNNISKTPTYIQRADYNLWIAGVQITSQNASNIKASCADITSGNITYDRATKTLTLDNATLQTNGNSIRAFENLKIKLIGKNTINKIGTGELAAIVNDYYSTNTDQQATEIFSESSSSGSLDINSETIGIYANGGGLNINNCMLNVKGKSYGITGYNGGDYEILSISNADVTVSGPGRGSITDFKSINTLSCSVISPDGAKVGTYNGRAYVVDVNGEPVKSEVIIAEKYYWLDIAGIKVTNINKSDVLGDGGSVSYDPDMHLLTLNNATINVSDHIGILAYEPMLIRLIGENSIITNKSGVIFSHEGTIYSLDEGSLAISATTSGSAISGLNSIDINDCTVYAFSNQGIAINGAGADMYSASKLNINNSTVSATGDNGSIINWAEINLEGCKVTQPENLVVELSKEPYGYIDIEGKAYKYKILIEPKTTITIEDITTMIDRYLNSEPGISIENITSLIDQYLAQ